MREPFTTHFTSTDALFVVGVAFQSSAKVIVMPSFVTSTSFIVLSKV